MLEEASPSWEPPRRAAAALPPAGTTPSAPMFPPLLSKCGERHREMLSTGAGAAQELPQPMPTGPRSPFAAPPGASLLPSRPGGRFRPCTPHRAQGTPSTKGTNLSSQLPQAAPSPLLPAPRTPNSHPPAPSSPSIPSSDSAVTTRPPHAPSLPTTQLPLQQETAPVNHCSSPLICLPGCEERRTRGCESPPALCPRGSSSFIGPGQGRGSCRAAGEMARPQPLWGRFSHMTAP